ncbi:hypothetical protein BH10PLA2_BH10PLA2_27870 [soil metagenome]
MWLMRRWKWFLVTGLVVLIGILSIGPLFSGSPPEDRARAYFAMPINEEVNSSSIRAAFLRLVPLGSGESDVGEFVDQSTIGKDGLSNYHSPENGKGYIHIRYDPRSLEFVKREFAIMLQFDDAGKLREIEVKTWLTGP